MLELKADSDTFQIIIGNFNTPFSLINVSYGQKIRKDKDGLNSSP